MYSKTEIQRLQKDTQEFIKKEKQGVVFNKEVDALRETLRFHEHRYYILNDPLIADGEYDKLYKLLEKTEQENPELITVDSPTQR